MTVWGPTTSKKGRFVVDLLLLLASAFALFVMTTQLVEPFSKLLAALNHTSFLRDWQAWALAASFALPWGLMWLAFFMVFEVVKEDLLGVLAQDEADAARQRRRSINPKARNALARRRRALQVLRRTVPARRSL